MQFIEVIRKITTLIIAGGVLVILSVATSQAEWQILTFSDVWQAALEQTPEMLLARARTGEAEAALATAQGHLLPRLSATYTGSTSDNPLNVFGMKLTQGDATFNDFGAGEFIADPLSSLHVAPGNLNSPGWYDNYQSKLELQVPIYNGGKTRAYLNQAQAYLESARQLDVMARQQLMLEVLKAYEGVRAADAFLAVADKSVAAALSYSKITDQLFDRGVISYNDQLRARLNLDSARLHRREALTQRDQVCDSLRILAGLPDNIPVAVAGPLSVPLQQAELAQLQQQMESDNPGLLALKNKEAAVQTEVQIARAAYLPHFNLILSQEWNAPDLRLGGNSAAMIAGVLSWNLFDFGVRKGGVVLARQHSLQQTAERRIVANRIRLQLNAAWRNARLAAESVKVNELAVSQAEEAERLERLRYEQGVSTMTELLLIRAQLDKAHGDLVLARYQELMERAGLLLALGRLTPETITERPVAQHSG